ncbi:MAG: DUF432 domain-containing protein [Spirochaetia bacterium]|jgi:hypothetical protein|nr:DUF432 domain-containing protein [Spirochaetia bacterium]
MELLKYYTIKENITCCCRIGYLEFWIRKISDEWMISFTHAEQLGENNIIEVTDKPDHLDWIRIISENSSSGIILKPAMPDKPVIVQSQEEIRILERQKSSITVKIPANYRLYTESNNEEKMLFEFPSEIMSKTWFGELLTGMMAYSLNTNIMAGNILTPGDNYIYCKIKIINTAKKSFNFKKLSIPVNNMNIYESYGNDFKIFITDNLLIEYADDDKIKISVDDIELKSGNNKIIYETQKSIQDKSILIKGVTSFIKTVTGI